MKKSMPKFIIRFVAVLLIPCLVSAQFAEFRVQQEKSIKLFTELYALNSVKFTSQALSPKAAPFSGGPLTLWTQTLHDMLAKRSLFENKEAIKGHYFFNQIFYERAQAMSAGTIPPGHAYRGMRLTLDQFAEVIREGLRAKKTTNFGEGNIEQIRFAKHRWYAVHHAFFPEGEPPEENFISVIAVANREWIHTLEPGIDLPAEAIEWYVYDKIAHQFIDLRQMQSSLSPVGLLPNVAERLAKYFGGVTSRMYQWVVGPFIEEWFGERIHTGSGFRCLLSYAPLGFSTIPMVLAMALHGLGKSGVPHLITFILHSHAGMWIPEEMSNVFQSAAFLPIFGVVITLGVTVLLRRRFIFAHPESKRAAAVVISAINSILPFWILYQKHFSLEGLAWGLLSAAVIHGLANVFCVPIQRGWNILKWQWLWSRDPTPDNRRRAIHWSFDRYIESYHLGAEPEFNRPSSPLRPEDSRLGSEWPEVFAGIVEVVFHLPGTAFWKMGLDWLTHLLRKVLIKRMVQLGKGEESHALVREAIEKIDLASSLEERRRLLRGYFQRYGYLISEQTITDFPSYNKKMASTADYIGEREDAIQRLEGYFFGIMQWKREPITEDLDKEILRFVESKLNDPDPYVAKAAIRAIGVVENYLTPMDRERLLQRYQDLFSRRRDEVIQGSIARDFSQELDSPRNVMVLARSLRGDSLSPAVQAYVAESLETLLEKYPLNPKDDPKAFENLVHLLIRKAENPHVIGAVRVSSLKALAFMQEINDAEFAQLQQLFLSDPNPTLQEAAMFALAHLSCASAQQSESFLRSLADFVKGDHAGPPNPFLECFGRDLFDQLAAGQEDSALRERAHQLHVRDTLKTKNPVIFLDVGPLAAEDFRRLAGLRRYLKNSGGAVIDTDSFRQDRDKALRVEKNQAYRPIMLLQVAQMLPALQNLSNNLPARETLWDPARRKRARRMESVLAPYPHQPIIIFGRGSEESEAIQGVYKNPISFIQLSDHMTPSGRIDYQSLRASIWERSNLSPLDLGTGHVTSEAPPLPKDLAPLFIRRSPRPDPVPLVTLQNQWPLLFAGDHTASPEEIAQLVHVFDPTLIYSDIDLSLNQATNSSLSDIEYPDNQTSLYFLGANMIAGRIINFISMNSGEMTMQTVHRPLELLLERTFPGRLKYQNLFYDAGAVAVHPTDGRHFFVHGRQRRFSDNYRRDLVRSIVRTYFDQLPALVKTFAIRSTLRADFVRRRRDAALAKLEEAFNQTTWQHASTHQRFESQIEPLTLGKALKLPAIRLVDTGAQIGLLIPSISFGEVAINHPLADALAQQLRSHFAADIHKEMLYVSSGSDYLAFSVTSKGLRVREEIERKLRQWHNPRNGNKGPLRVLVMGDSDADIPMLGLKMEGVEILPLFLGKHPQVGMVTSAISHARGAAVAMASLLSPDQIRGILKARFDAYPTDAAYREEIQNLFEEVARVIESTDGSFVTHNRKNLENGTNHSDQDLLRAA
jgi:HEAT repeat protein